MKKMQFNRKNAIFHKLINDEILALLSYRTYSSGHELTIQFDFYPLCVGAEVTAFMDSNYTLSNIYSDAEYVILSQGDVSGAFEAMLDLCKEGVFPLFDTIIDYKSYFDFVRKTSGIDLAIERKLHSDNIYLPLRHYINVLLALKEYELALLAMDADIKQSQIALEDYAKRQNMLIIHDKRYPKYLEKEDNYRKVKELIERKEFESIENMIKQYENISKNSYIHSYSINL